MKTTVESYNLKNRKTVQAMGSTSMKTTVELYNLILEKSVQTMRSTS